MNPLTELTSREPEWIRRWRLQRAYINRFMADARMAVVALQIAGMKAELGR